MELVWNSEKDKVIFNAVCLTDFNSFWELPYKNNIASNITLTLVRKHVKKYTGQVERSVYRLEINKVVYFMKRSSDKGFNSLLNEFEASKILPNFGLRYPTIAVYGFNFKKKYGFMVLKNLGGFYTLRDIVNFSAPAEDIATFETRRLEYLERLVQIFYNLKRANYFYQDWYDKHIFFNVGTDEIALIDLENFFHISKMPWYQRFKVYTGRYHKKEIRRFKSALISRIYSKKLVESVVKKYQNM